jgi:hypothetical protein
MPPRIITARSIGLEFRTNQLGAMGPETSVVGHYSATPRAETTKAGIAAAKSFHRAHLNNGWAGIGYHYVIPDTGAIICCRSTFHTGAHVLNKNSGRIGVNMPGTLGDRPTRRQARAFNWLLHNAHTDAMPRRHRTDNNLSNVGLTVHNNLMPTSCPGLFKRMYLRGGEPWVEPSGDTAEAIDDGLVDLAPEDEELAAEIDAGKRPDPDTDAAAVGPDEKELSAPVDEDLELPEVDPDFDEDLTELLEEIEIDEKQPLV